MEKKIRNAALKLFAKKGYEESSLSKIALEAGVDENLIYSYYKSKDEIFFKIIQDLFHNIMEKIEDYANVPEMRRMDLKDVLFQIFTGYYHYFAEHDLELLLWQRLRFFPPFCVNEKFNINSLFYDKPIVDCYLELFKTGIENKQLMKCDEGILVMTFFSFVSGYIDSLLIVPYELSERELKESFEIYWEGIRYKELIRM